MSSPSVVKAKRFLINRIVDQAKRVNVPLTDIEVHMLGFAPVAASPAEHEAAAVFERDYDREKYEAKISRLFQDVHEMDKSLGRAEIWEQSLDALANEDVYLAVIIRRTGLRQAPVPWYLPDLGSMRQYLTAIIMVSAGILVAFTPIGGRLVPDPLLRSFLVLCCWVTPWLISKIAKAHADEDVEASDSGGQDSEPPPPPPPTLKRARLS